jgi:hypothetical protein
MNAPRVWEVGFSVRPDGPGWIEGSAGAGAGEEAQPFSRLQRTSLPALSQRQETREQSRGERASEMAPPAFARTGPPSGPPQPSHGLPPLPLPIAAAATPSLPSGALC